MSLKQRIKASAYVSGAQTPMSRKSGETWGTRLPFGGWPRSQAPTPMSRETSET